MTKFQPIVDALAQTARAQMPPAEAARFEAEVARVFRIRPKRNPKDLEREHLLQRHCPAQLPPVTLDRVTRPRPAIRRRRRHTWTRPKQLRLQF